MSAKKHRIYFKLQVAAHALQKYADRLLLESGGITTAQAALLNLVQAGNNVTQRELARTLRQNESAITAMVSRLQTLKMLVKQRSREDARVWTLSITRKGETALKAIKHSFVKVNKHIEATVSQDELERFADALTALAKIN